MVVPQKDFVGMELRSITTSNQGQNVASEQHLTDGNASSELWTKLAMTRVLTSLELVPVGEGVVNVKSVLGAHAETALVLIKAHVQ